MADDLISQLYASGAIEVVSRGRNVWDLYTQNLETRAKLVEQLASLGFSKIKEEPEFILESRDDYIRILTDTPVRLAAFETTIAHLGEFKNQEAIIQVFPSLYDLIKSNPVLTQRFFDLIEAKLSNLTTNTLLAIGQIFIDMCAKMSYHRRAQVLELLNQRLHVTRPFWHYEIRGVLILMESITK